MDNDVSMFTGDDGLEFGLYDEWDNSPPTSNTHDGLGSRHAPIDLDDSPDVKIEDLWKDQCPELPDESDDEIQEIVPDTAVVTVGAATTATAQTPPSSAPAPAPAPAPKPEPDAFERYLKLKMRKLDRKRRQAEEQAAHWTRERRDVIESIDRMAQPEDETAAMRVQLAAWDTRVKQMGAALLAAKAGRKATRLKMDLREYRGRREQEKAKELLEAYSLMNHMPDSVFVDLVNGDTSSEEANAGAGPLWSGQSSGSYRPQPLLHFNHQFVQPSYGQETAKER